MKCTNNRKRCFISFVLSVMLCITFLTGCGQSYDIPYDVNASNSSYTLNNNSIADKADAFASNVCVAQDNYNESAVDMSEATAAALFSVNDNEILYAKNVHESLYPASLTKVMTALVALKNGNRDDILTATNNVRITESGAQLAGVEPGDTMTLDQALRIMLMYSANDVAIMIAEQYGGTVDEFSNMMNIEAQEIGATNCHFTNPNGLNDAELYVTAYDLYLIFNEACKYDLFKEIISMVTYSTTYYNRNGETKTFEKSSTNQFINGTETAPQGITVLGGKTGTTTAAGHCLILLSSDIHGKSYISIILQSSERTVLYEEMINLLAIINN